MKEGASERAYDRELALCMQPLRTLRSQYGYENATEFARALNIPVSTYKRYEEDVSKMPVSALMTICNLLDISADQVLGFKEMPTGDTRVQIIYESLSLEDQEVTDALLGVMKKRSDARKQNEQDIAGKRYESLSRYYENLLYSKLDELWPNEQEEALVGAPYDKTDQFIEFVYRQMCDRVIDDADITRKRIECEVPEETAEAKAWAKARRSDLLAELRGITEAYARTHRSEFELYPSMEWGAIYSEEYYEDWEAAYTFGYDF